MYEATVCVWMHYYTPLSRLAVEEARVQERAQLVV